MNVFVSKTLSNHFVCFGENKGHFGENKGLFGENKPLFGENDRIFGENNGDFGGNKGLFEENEPDIERESLFLDVFCLEKPLTI